MRRALTISSVPDKLAAAVAVSVIVLARLPVYFGHAQPLRLGVLLLLWGCIVRLTPQRRILNEGAIVVALLYAATLFVEVYRGADAGVRGGVAPALVEGTLYVTVVVFAASLVGSAPDRRAREGYLVCLALAPALYVTVNALMHLAGMVSPATLDAGSASIALGDPAELLASLGIGATRVQFPLATSINLFSVVGAAALASALVLLLQRSRAVPRFVLLLAGAGGLYVLLYGDSRGAMGAAVVVALWFARRRRMTPAPYLALLLPVMALVLLQILGWLDAAGLGEDLSRDANGDFASGTNRLYIWQGAWKVLGHPSVDHVFGWGAAGQITSHASDGYAYMFAGRPNPYSMPTHNVALQTIADGGYVALAVLVLALFTALRLLVRYAIRQESPGASALAAAVITVVLNGTSEVAPTYYSQEALLVVLMAAGAAAAIPWRSRPPAPPVSDFWARMAAKARRTAAADAESAVPPLRGPT